MPSLPRVSRWVVLVVLAALLGAVGGTTALRDRVGSPKPQDSPRAQVKIPEAAQLLGDPPQSVIELRGTSLVHISLATAAEDVLGKIPLPDAVVDAERRLVYYTAAESKDDPEPLVRRAALLDPEGGITLGPGTRPLLSPDGSYLAALQDPSGTRVVLYEAPAEDGEPTHLLSEDRWELLGWTSENTLVARAENGDLYTTGPRDEGGTKVQGLHGADVVVVSPTAPEALVRTQRGFAIRSLNGGKDIRIRLGDRSDLVGGSWAPEGFWIAGGLTRRSYPEIALIDTSDGTWKPMNEARAAAPDIVWSTGQRHFASHIEKGDGGFDIVVCGVDRDCVRPVQTKRRPRILALI